MSKSEIDWLQHLRRTQVDVLRPYRKVRLERPKVIRRYYRERLSLMRGEGVILNVSGYILRNVPIPIRGGWTIIRDVLLQLLPAHSLVWPLVIENSDLDDVVYFEILGREDKYRSDYAFIAGISLLDGVIHIVPTSLRKLYMWKSLLDKLLIFCFEFSMYYPYWLYMYIREKGFSLSGGSRNFVFRRFRMQDRVLRDWADALIHKREPLIPFPEDLFNRVNLEVYHAVTEK